MLRSVSGLVATLVLVIGAQAQDTPRLQSAIDALSSPPGADEIAALGASDANAYVYFVQDFLRGKGRYDGAVDGQLTNAAIRAIIAYCREAGFAETCSRGPLLPQSIAAVSGAIAAALAPAKAEAAAEPVAVAPPAEVAAPVVGIAEAVLPDGWKFSDNGRFGSVGIAADLVSAGPDTATIRFSGTATRQGYFNVELAPMQPAAETTWVTSLRAARTLAPESKGTVLLRTALFDASGGYVGELFDGVPLPQGDAPRPISGEGSIPAKASQVVPYVQLWLNAGDVVDTTLTLAGPSFSRQ